jgi:hypothetical protein
MNPSYRKQEKTKMKKIIIGDYSKDAGKLGRHNLSFKTGIHIDKKKQSNKMACRKNMDF